SSGLASSGPASLTNAPAAPASKARAEWAAEDSAASDSRLRLSRRLQFMDGSLNAVFAVMPFADPSMPTLGVSLLKAACTRDGVPSRIRYFNIDFVDRIGVDLYRRIANSFPPESLVGEWFFADLVFGDTIPHEEDYLTN